MRLEGFRVENACEKGRPCVCWKDVDKKDKGGEAHDDARGFLPGSTHWTHALARKGRKIKCVTGRGGYDLDRSQGGECKPRMRLWVEHA